MSTVIHLVSADPHLAQLMRETGMPFSVVPRDALSGLASAGAKQPAALVVDLRQESQIPTQLVALKRTHPSTGVLLVAAKLDPTLLLEAMRSGVNEFVTAPVTASDLLAAMKRLMGTLAPSSRGDIFAFIGAKGGVGATTVAVNVASSLAKSHPDSTLLIDLNLTCGDAAVYLGAEPRFSVTDALENVQRLDSAFLSGLVVRTKGGLDLLGAPSRPAMKYFEPVQIRALLDFATQIKPYTIIDVSRSDSAALDSLELASRIVLVVNQELATVRSASRIATTLKQRYGLSRLNLVLSRNDRKAEIGIDDVEKTVGLEVLQVFPSDYRLALQAMNKGRPLVLDSPNGLGGAFKTFAKQLAGVTETTETEKPKAGSLFGRLAPRKA